MTDSIDLTIRWRARTEQALACLLIEKASVPGTERLQAAMHYSLNAGGKRLRPVLMFAAAHACGGSSASDEDLDRIASALECIHTYSLIHDDLPAMDNDDLRRGKPTCHRAYDEATAILAGDALQTLAFNLIAEATTVSAEVRIEIVNNLARHSGLSGMAGGQAIDMHHVGQQLTQAQLAQMHALKTGALIESALIIGALLADASAEQHAALLRYGRAIGLAFQVQDDILDAIGDTGVLGKTAGADAALNKPTYVSLLGPAAAAELAQALIADAIAALDSLGPAATSLIELARFIIARDR